MTIEKYLKLRYTECDLKYILKYGVKFMLKKMLSILFTLSILSINSVPVLAQTAEQTKAIEHLDVHKNAPCNVVTITNLRNVIEKGNVLQFVFDEKYFSKCSKAGEFVNFVVPQALYTREGTLLLPCGTKIVAEVINVEKPKWFNKNARVSLVFRKIVFPDNTCIDIKARPFTKDYKLKEGPWTTTGKLVLSTLTLGIVGAGAGVGFAFIPNPAEIGTGLAIGIPIGCGVGLVVGLITPGCHYKAKKGEAVYAILMDEVSICK